MNFKYKKIINSLDEFKEIYLYSLDKVYCFFSEFNNTTDDCKNDILKFFISDYYLNCDIEKKRKISDQFFSKIPRYYSFNFLISQYNPNYLENFLHLEKEKFFYYNKQYFGYQNYLQIVSEVCQYEDLKFNEFIAKISDFNVNCFFITYKIINSEPKNKKTILLNFIDSFSSDKRKDFIKNYITINFFNNYCKNKNFKQSKINIDFELSKYYKKIPLDLLKILVSFVNSEQYDYKQISNLILSKDVFHLFNINDLIYNPLHISNEQVQFDLFINIWKDILPLLQKKLSIEKLSLNLVIEYLNTIDNKNRIPFQPFLEFICKENLKSPIDIQILKYILKKTATFQNKEIFYSTFNIINEQNNLKTFEIFDFLLSEESNEWKSYNIHKKFKSNLNFLKPVLMELQNNLLNEQIECKNSTYFVKKNKI